MQERVKVPHIQLRQKQRIESQKSTTKTIYDTNILAKESATGKAITYALNQEKFLRVFLNDERLPMDNNEAERTG